MSDELRALYLDPARAGVPWLLDPGNPAVRAGIAAAKRGDYRSPCDPRAVAADLGDLLVLLRERHFGLATGAVRGDRLNGWAERWRDRLRSEHPETWGGAYGTDFHRLRQLLGDNHVLTMRHEDQSLLATVNPRGGEPILDDADGPAYEERTIRGLLCIRVRRLAGGVEDGRALERWRTSHERHFSHDRIIVDLRGCRGGSAEHAREWAAAHVPEPGRVQPPKRTWMLDDQPLAGWNDLIEAEAEAVHGARDVPARKRQLRPSPHPDARLWIAEDDGLVPAGDRPWSGRMLVLVDRGTVSAGEATAWSLRSMFGARLAGSPTRGCVSFGDVAAYLLPRSGMAIVLPTSRRLYPDVELTGIPVDVALDPSTPIAEVASEFDQLAGS